MTLPKKCHCQGINCKRHPVLQDHMAILDYRIGSYVLRCIKRLVSINTIILNTLLNACEMGSQWQQALHLVTSLPHNADSISFSRVAAACCAAARWQIAVQVLRQQKQGYRQVAGDIAVAAMNACARKERWKEMLMWFEGLRSDLVCIDLEFLNSAIWP